MRGYRVVLDVFDRVDSPSLRALVVFLPMVGGDDEAAARERTLESRDPRIATAWDLRRGVGRALRGTLGLRGVAWDVYLVYPPGVTWDADRPPAPREWMHQLWELAETRPEQELDPEGLREMVARALPEGGDAERRDARAPGAHAAW